MNGFGYEIISIFNRFFFVILIMSLHSFYFYSTQFTSLAFSNYAGAGFQSNRMQLSTNVLQGATEYLASSTQ